MKPTKRIRVHLKHFILAMGLGIGLGAGGASAQTVLEVAGDGVIGDEILASNSLPASGSTFTADGGEGFTSSVLISPNVEVTTNGAVTLEFDHRYFIEANWDGAAVFVSVNGAPATYLPGSAFSANGYVGDTLANTPNTAWEGGEDVFYGKTAGYDDDPPAFIESVANLGTFTAGDIISVEFHIRWDGGYFEPDTNWEIGAVRINDAAPSTLLDVEFTTDGTAGFTVENVGTPVGPWTYLRPVSTFELDADLDTADRYAPPAAGSVIDLNDAALAVELLNGDLQAGDSFTLFDLAGGTTLTGTYSSLILPAGTWDTSNFTVDGTITLLVLPPLLEELFDYAPGALNGKNGGTGFDGPWAATKRNPQVTEATNYWGTLATSGNRLNSNAWSALIRPIGTTLSDKGLMDDGATLWFSYVMDITGQNLTNLDYNFALCTDQFEAGDYANRTNLVNNGEGIGVSNITAGRIRGAFWQDDGDGDGFAEATRTDTFLTLNGSDNARALIVGKIEWGATGTVGERLTLYTPDMELNLGTPILDSWLTRALDQSQFDSLCIQWKDSQPSIDEIRFGATSADVLPVDITAPSLVSTIPENGDPQGSGVFYVATLDAPASIGTGNIRIIDADGPTTLTTIDVTDASQVAVSADGFSLELTPTTLPTPGNTYYVEFDAGVVTDPAGNALPAISGPDTWSFTASDTAPTVVSIDNTPAASTIYGTPVITYSVTFDKFYMDDATVTEGDFTNAGTAGITVGAVTRTSGPLDPAVYTFDVTTNSFGTVELQVAGAISDRIGNPLVAPVNDDTVLTLDPGPEPTRETVTFDGFSAFSDGGNPVSFTYNASGSDKLVVVVTGEHNFGGNLSGDVTSVTYDGISLTKAVEVSPTAPSLQTTSDLWYLDDPGSVHSAGIVAIEVVGNGNNYVHTAIGLSGTAPGFGAAASAVGTSSVDLITSSSSSFVISWVGMGGSGNTASPLPGVMANSPAGAITIDGREAGANYGGHAVARSEGLAVGRHTFSFDTTKTDVLGFAVEFIAAIDTSDYTMWKALYPEADLDDPDADYDGDGLSNDEERLFGLDPTSPASQNPIAVPLDAAVGTFSFTRRDDALTGLFSGVETSTDLVMWTKDAGATLVPGAPDANGVETVAVTLSPGLLTAPQLYVRVIQDDGSLLSENFEDGKGGFTVVTSAGSDWEFGTPTSVGFGGEVLEGNGGSANCWGTDIGNPGEYAVPTATKLRSPVIDLTGVSGAQLTFAQAMDLEVADTAVVNIIAEASDTVIATVYTATDSDINNAGWGTVPAIDLAAGIGMKVRLEWAFTGGTLEYLGWYIDDVTVSQPAP